MKPGSERLIENTPGLERVVLFRMSHSQIVEVLRIQRTAGRALLQQLNDVSEFVSFVT